MLDGISYETLWEPQPRQELLLTCPVFEVFFGGARGGGKSDAVLGEWASHAQEWGEYAIGLCVRRERTQLTELVERSKTLYTRLGAKFHEQDKMWRFPNGARLRFAYLENDSDAQSYQGHSYTRVYIEEMGTFPNPDPIFKLMATLRPTGPPVPSNVPRFIATGNPGGPGHLWIKKRYIDPAPFGLTIITSDFGNGIVKERVFIPSKIQDNKYTNNPDYIGNLYLSGNEELVKAWLLGDWNVTLGAFFQEWSTEKHVIRSFTPPKHWTRFMSFDMGSMYPFSAGWWCVVPDEYDTQLDYEIKDLAGKRLILPKNSIIRYREWYGSQANHTATAITENSTENMNNKGIKFTTEEIAAGIVFRERNEPKNESGLPRIAYRVADPIIFKHDGGPSNAERFSNLPYRINFIRADNTRVGARGALGGWDIMRQRLKGDGIRPTIYFMDVCKDAIRTIPALQHDPSHLEDADDEGEDHACDETRYACMSRPFSVSTKVEDEIRKVFKGGRNSIPADGKLLFHDLIEDMPMYSNSRYSKICV